MELKDLIFITVVLVVGIQIFYGIVPSIPIMFGTQNASITTDDCQQQIAQKQEQIDSLQREKQSLEAQTSSFSSLDMIIGAILGCIASLFIYWQIDLYFKERGKHPDVKAEAQAFIRRFVTIEKTKKQARNARKMHRKKKA